MIKKTFRLSLILSMLFLVSLSANSCSSISTTSSSNNPEVKRLLIGLSTNYFSNIIQSNYAVIDANIIWYNYIRNNGTSYSKKEYYVQLVNLNKKYLNKNHPLNNTKFIKAKIRGDNADIYFSSTDLNDEIKLSYTWSGSAWFLVDDNLFADGLLR